MTHAIALLPWVHSQEELTVRQLRLFPYAFGRLPGNLPNATQTDIDSVFSAYATRPNISVKHGTIVELGEWQTGTDESPHLADLFRARHALAFAALARRQLFNGHFNYTNTDAYALVVQRYRPGDAGSFSFNTRRRDTGTSHLWSSKDFAFQRPNHVSNHWKIDVDQTLLATVLELEPDSVLREAIQEFNQANTDSPDIPEHVEMVMVKSAFELLLGIGTSSDNFVEALHGQLASVLAAPETTGELTDRWSKRWSKAERLLEAWARDFCDVRGSGAHGSGKTAARFVWPAHTHLAFASIFFPLLFKKYLADEGRLTLDPADYEQLRTIESLLVVDPYSPKALSLQDDNSHPWSEFQFYARFMARERKWRVEPPSE